MIWDMVGVAMLALCKLLGILLLILFVLLLLVLWIPVRYRVRAVIQEEYEINGCFRWLGILVRLPFRWRDGQVHWKLQILGIPFFRNTVDNVHTDRKKTGNQKKRKKTSSAAGKKEPESEQDLGRNENNVQENVCQKEENAENVSWEEKEYAPPAGYNPPEDAQNRKKPKKRSLFFRMREKIQKIFQAIQGLMQMFHSRVHSVRDFIHLLRGDAARRFICIAKGNMLQLWRHIRPQKIWGDIRFGTGDPCSTGQILGGIAVLYGWIGTGVHITPDFEQACLEGRLEGKGRMRTITMLVIVLRLFVNKDFRGLLGELRQWKEDF